MGLRTPKTTTATNDVVEIANNIVLKWSMQNPDPKKAKRVAKKLQTQELLSNEPYKTFLESWEQWRDFYGLPAQHSISPSLILEIVGWCHDNSFNIVIMLGSVCREHKRNWGLATLGQILVDGDNIYRKNYEEVVKDLELI